MARIKQKREGLPAQVRVGTVVRNTGSSYIVRFDDDAEPHEANCIVKGKFRISGIRTTNPVAVGDRVEVSHREGDTDFISAILPRRNYVVRRASNLSKESHILASNIDIAMLVVTLRFPEISTTFVDRFLATCEAYNIPASIIINKCDLWDEVDAELADALKYLYEGLGYPVYFVSAEEGRGLDALREATKEKLTLLAGNSGVGKSSIINALVPGANLRTGEISDVHHTGMHTTTFSEMVDLPYGGALIDVPGVRGFGTIDFQPEEVGHFFPEIFEKSKECRFSDCKHTGEPGCAVLPAVENHEIAQSRYASYLSILEEAGEADGADKYRKPY